MSSTLNLTAAGVIKPGPGCVVKAVIIAGGSSGAFRLHDAATFNNATGNNVIWSAPFNAVVGTVYDIICPAVNGITLSAVPAGSPVIAVSWS
jgi:hypothetical protein